MLPKVRKILYSTDLSKSSTAAFEHATYLAKQTGADIHILHVVEKLSSDAKITLQTYVMDSKSRHDLYRNVSITQLINCTHVRITSGIHCIRMKLKFANRSSLSILWRRTLLKQSSKHLKN
ncbi:universal stress protein [Aliamphritea spongicola]